LSTVQLAKFDAFLLRHSVELSEVLKKRARLVMFIHKIYFQQTV